MEVICCPATLGSGGIGRHAVEYVRDFRTRGRSTMLIDRSSTELGSIDDIHHHPIIDGAMSHALKRLSHRSTALRHYTDQALFDRQAAAALPSGVEMISAFAGSARACFARASSATKTLIAANSHISHVQQQHALARNYSHVEPSWLGTLQVRRILREYEEADVIIVASRYTECSFLEHGVAPARLRRQELSAEGRFTSATRRPHDGPPVLTFTGSLTAAKGIPLILDILAALPAAEFELRLVGGWSTRRMRILIQSAMAADRRIRVVPGDPLPHLEVSTLHLHPSWEDGFGYAVAEAAAVGVPVLVSADTGAAELQLPPGSQVLPTGSLQAWVEAVAARL